MKVIGQSANSMGCLSAKLFSSELRMRWLSRSPIFENAMRSVVSVKLSGSVYFANDLPPSSETWISASASTLPRTTVGQAAGRERGRTG